MAKKNQHDRHLTQDIKAESLDTKAESTSAATVPQGNTTETKAYDTNTDDAKTASAKSPAAAANTEANKAESDKSETAKTEADKSEANKAEAAKTEAAKTESTADSSIKSDSSTKAEDANASEKQKEPSVRENFNAERAARAAAALAAARAAKKAFAEKAAAEAKAAGTATNSDKAAPAPAEALKDINAEETAKLQDSAAASSKKENAESQSTANDTKASAKSASARSSDTKNSGSKSSGSKSSGAKSGGSKNSGSGLRALFAGFILAFIALACTVGVLYVENTTEDTITANRNARENELMQSMLPGIEKEAHGAISYDCRLVSSPYIGNKMRLYIAKDERQKTLGYIVTYSTNRGYSNPLIFIAGVNKDLTIRRVDVQLSKETPGLGDKVEQRKGNYMDQFVGKSLSNANWEVKKFNGDFDYFTGATVTSRAVVLATHDLLKGLSEINIESLPQCPLNQGGN